MQTENIEGLRDLIWFTFHLTHQQNIFNKQTHPPCWGEPFPLVPELRGDEKTLSFRLTFWLQGHQRPKVSYWLCINQSDRFWNQKSETGLTWETVQAGHPSCSQTGHRDRQVRKTDRSEKERQIRETGQKERDRSEGDRQVRERGLMIYFTVNLITKEYFSTCSRMCTCSSVCTWRRVLICSWGFSINPADWEVESTCRWHHTYIHHTCRFISVFNTCTEVDSLTCTWGQTLSSRNNPRLTSGRFGSN